MAFCCGQRASLCWEIWAWRSLRLTGEAGQILGSFGGLRGGGEDGAAVSTHHPEPVADVVGMVGTGLDRDTKFGAQERAGQLGNLS